jgi:hypothetical protein
MYRRKDKSILMKSTASPLLSNLSICVDPSEAFIYYAVAHRTEVNLIVSSIDGTNVVHKQIANKESYVQYSKCAVQVRLVPVSKKIILVLTSRTSIQMFDAETTKTIFYQPIAETTKADKTETFGRGICGVIDQFIIVGSHSGDLWLFAVPEKGTNVLLISTLKDMHHDAVCALESDGDRVVSTDTFGTIVVWRFNKDKSLTKLRTFTGTGSPCTCVAIWKGFVVGGYSTGHLRVFNIADDYMVAEVTAHARCVTSLHVAKNTGRLLSGSEDTFIRVWQLSEESPEVKHLDSLCYEDQQIQGACFVDNDGRAFGCTSYDNIALTFFST